MESTLRIIDSKASLIKKLEKEAFRLKMEIEKIDNKRKRELAQKKHDKLILRIIEIKDTHPLKLTRYE